MYVCTCYGKLSHATVTLTWYTPLLCPCKLCVAVSKLRRSQSITAPSDPPVATT